MGEDVQVRARIRSIDLYSGHADGDELVNWLRERLPIRKGLFLVHGEPGRIEALKRDALELGREVGRVLVPDLDDEADLSADRPTFLSTEGPRLAKEDVAQLDWHNDLAQFSLDLREALEGAADERSRRILMRRLQRALEGREA